MKYYIQFLASDVIARAMTTLSYFLCARTLSVSQFGILSIAGSIIGFASILSDCGLSTLGTRFIAEGNTIFTDKIVSLKLINSILIYIVLSAFVFFYRSPTYAVLPLFALWLIPLGLSPEWIFQGLRQIRLIGLYRFICASTLLILTVFLCLAYPGNIRLLAVARFFSEIVSIILITIVTKSGIPKLPSKLPHDFNLLTASLPYALSTIFTNIYSSNLDFVVVGFFRGPEEVGLYASAIRIYLILVLFPKLLVTKYFPIFVSVHQSRNESTIQVNKFLDTSIKIGLPLIVFLVLNKESVVSILYGSKYVNSDSLLALLAITSLVVLLNAPLGSFILASGKPMQASFLVSFASIVNVILNLVLVPFLGALGASISMLAAELIVLCLGLALCYKMFGLIPSIPFQAILPSLFLLITLPLLLNLLSLFQINVFVKTLAALTVFIGTACWIYTVPTFRINED